MSHSLWLQERNQQKCVWHFFWELKFVMRIIDFFGSFFIIQNIANLFNK